MTSNSTKDTDSKPAAEHDETPNPEREGESPTEVAIETARGTEDEPTPDEVSGTEEAVAAEGASADNSAEEEPATTEAVQGSGAVAAAGTSIGSLVAGAGAVVSAGIGLSSITGTSLGEMLRSRQEIIGQIEAATGGGGDQIHAFYGAPWNTAAVVNGIFALIAIVIGGVVLAAITRKAGTVPWVKIVAVGGIALGVIGLFVAGGMFFDVFAEQPALPAGAVPGAGG